MTTYFTSDSHWNHDRIILYCNRPYQSVGEMNEALIANWNERVGPDDEVYHLGDFAMGDKSLIPGILARLNGKIILIAGNHDLDKKGNVLKVYQDALGKQIVEIHQELYRIVDGVRLYMRHIPDISDDFMVEHWRDRADFHLCGHVHGSWTRKAPDIENVGIDVCEYKPMTLAELFLRPPIEGKSHRGY